MKCKLQKNIEPYIRGELEGASQAKMKAHLQYCETCQMYLNELKEHEQLLAKVKRYNPTLSDPGSFRNEVIQMIDTEPESALSRVITRPKLVAVQFIDQVVSALLLPVTRYAFISAAMVIFGVFIYQQTSIMQKVDSLEKRIETSQQSGDLERTGRRTADSLIKKLPDTLSGDMEYDELLEDYRILQLKHKVLLKALQERYPETYKDILNELENAGLKPDNLNI